MAPRKHVAATQKSVRASSEFWDCLYALPNNYGETEAEKLRAVMYRGKDRLEREIAALKAMDDAKAAEPPAQPKRQAL